MSQLDTTNVHNYSALDFFDLVEDTNLGDRLYLDIKLKMDLPENEIHGAVLLVSKASFIKAAEEVVEEAEETHEFDPDDYEAAKYTEWLNGSPINFKALKNSEVAYVLIYPSKSKHKHRY